MPQSEFNLRLIEEFRANGGAIVSEPFKGASILLLTTTGRKSGEARTTPVGYTMAGDRMYIHTVNAGRPQLPQWYFNLVANPQVTLELGKERYQARAVVMDDAESERLLAQFAGQEPRLQAVLDRMTAEAAPRPRRRIPIVRMERL
jgi:deazaflavin-dependent oxidoreductase (nitroreductase family)